MKNTLISFDLTDPDNNIELYKTLKLSYGFFLLEKVNVKNKSNNTIQPLSRYPKIPTNNSLENWDVLEKMKVFEKEIYEVIIRYNKNKYKLSSKELFNSYISLINFSIKFIKEREIDTCLFFNLPHQPFEYTLLKLSKILNIKFIVIRKLPSFHAKTTNFFFVTDNFPKSSSNFIANLKEPFNFENKEIINPILQDYINESIQLSNKNTIKFSKIHLGHKWKLKSIFHHFLNRFNDDKRILQSLYKMLIFIFKYLIIFNLQRIFVLRYVQFIEMKPNSSHKFCYFPLHYQPEATTNTLSKGYFHDQLNIIKLISDALPEGEYLYVREHPTYWHRLLVESIYSNRSLGFYRQIKKLHNVVLVDHKFDHKQLIANCKFTISISGTIAFESLSQNKYCLLFGGYFYNDFPNAINPKNYLQLKEIIYAIKNYPVMTSNQFLSTLYAISNSGFGLKEENYTKKDLIIPAADFISSSKLITTR